MNHFQKSLDRYITRIPEPDIPDYEAEASIYYETIDDIKTTLGLCEQDFRDVLDENDMPTMMVDTDFINSEEFYTLLFEHYKETLVGIYKKTL